MDAEQFLKRVRGLSFYGGQLAHVEVLPERPPRFGEPADGLSEGMRAALRTEGIDRLYTHQSQAIDLIRDGHNVTVVTGTASGKTLCYNVPVVEALAENSLATMLYIYPTKALAQDQLRGLGKFEDVEEADFLAGTYDGDTPQHLRRRLRDAGNIILTNPDMLHQGILPNHARWNRFFTHLRYVVIDEIHAYRGVFGSHLANVIHRLDRICRHYGSEPQFVCCSATIANPREHAENVTGREMRLVTDDGSPRGRRRFVLWNPPPLETAARGKDDEWRIGGDRRSPLWEATHLMAALVREEVQTIAFVRTRLAAELIYKNTREILRKVSGRLSDSVQAYRGGYLPEERRDIERRLVERDILGVASTNALELGIDIGTLDACIIVGYPGTISSLWQQSGRAGRGSEESLVILVGQNSPIDQYLMVHNDYLFAQNPEQAVVDPENPHVCVGHIQCAVHELPLPEEEAEAFGPYCPTILDLLEDEQSVSNIDGNYYWASSEYPAADVNLRNIAGPVYTIQEELSGRIIGTIDEISALFQLHDHAVYLHGADTFFVNKLDLEEKVAYVQKEELDYYTRAVSSSEIRIDSTEREEQWRGATTGYGEVTVTTTIPMFKKIRFHARDSVGFEKLELPPQHLETVGTWVAPPEELVEQMKEREMVVGEALTGVANALVEVAPMFVMCDPRDIGAVVNSSCLGRDALFLYDRYPGGMGYARKCLAGIDRIMATVRDVIEECGCEDGCPSCVGAAVPAFALSDIDSAVRGRIPDKEAARFLLGRLLQ